MQSTRETVVSRGRPVLAANWKMNLTPTEAEAYAARFLELHPPAPDRHVLFFPAALSLPAFVRATQERPDLEIGVQDVHQEMEGAHTGAVSAVMAWDAGARWGLAGHSERRREFGDDPELVGRKVERLVQAGLRPILCVGETLEERERGQLAEVLRRQIEGVLGGLAPRWRAADSAGPAPLIYAYEPVWAIGTGRTALPEDASAAHAILREEIGRFLGTQVSAEAVILYGGSVKASNIDALLAAEGIDGVLVGGASLDPEEFAKICRANGASRSGERAP
ncbi:MAG: triose-phosphate isomerase [Gemmatimonadota bacterium]